ncbi:DUF5665 domain-containing protein [Sporosalibacterium faouarense]|uniref:DUF5665 domain-containing protein n=1 Tax=Sporosalibacterium faouarense TaxID=516123 RepID=UPI00141D15EC|nr:DUF5665 domain-containing protein [Sporosalibacterium faouarense]MTI47753.1 hypothetical protein [Bacillota bacterium]
MGRKKNRVENKVEELSDLLENSRMTEYVEMMGDKKRLLFINFIIGIVRGFGMAIGFTILGALAIYILRMIIDLNLPLIGDFIAEIVKIVQENL